MKKITSLLMCSLFAVGASAQDWTPNVSSSTDIMEVATSRATSVTVATNGTDNAHWYILTQKRNGESATYDQGEGQGLMRASTAYTASSFNNKKAAECTQYLVRFINSSTVSGAYNIQFANGRYVDENLKSSSTPGAYKFYAINNNTTGDFAWNKTSDGSDYTNKVDNNGAGNNLAFWESGETTNIGGNNDWFIYPVTLKADGRLTVTYNIMINGQLVKKVETKQDAHSAAVLPQEMQNDYCSYTYSNATVDAAHTTITVTATVSNLPFEFSANAATAKWYKLQLRPASNKSYLAADTESKMMGQEEFRNIAEYKWAFVGNPYDVKVINKSTGDNAALAYEGAVKTTRPGSPVKVVENSQMTWVLCKNDAGFTLRATENSSCYLHNRVAEGITTLSTAEWSGAATDAGSTFKVEAVSAEDDYSSLLVAEYGSWFAGAKPVVDTYFTLSNAGYGRLKAKYDAQKTNCTKEQYEAFSEEFINDVMWPETGRYRIYAYTDDKANGEHSEVTKYYLNAASETSFKAAVEGSEAAAKSMATVFEVTAKEDGSYTLAVEGKNVSGVGSLGDNAATVDLEIAKPGKAWIKFNGAERSLWVEPFRTGNDKDRVVQWDAIDNLNCHWVFEDAEDVEVALHAIGSSSYATFHAPYAVTIDGAKAYTLTKKSASAAELNELQGVVPANTAVLLISSEGAPSAKAELHEEVAAFSGNNILVGSNFAYTKQAGDLFLGKKDGVAGFYEWKGTTLAANRAYIPATTAAGARAILFNGETTGINAATLNSDAQNTTYDLQGRRVEKVQKGLYIINGKKVVY